MNPNTVNPDLEPFLFRYPRTEDEYPIAKADFLNYLNKSILEADSKNFAIKDKCFFVHDDQTCIFADDNDNLCADNIAEIVETRIFGNHKSIAFLFKDDTHSHFFSVSPNGLIKVWNYQSLELVNELESPFKDIQEAFFYEKDKLFLYTTNDIIIINAKTGYFVENQLENNVARFMRAFKTQEITKSKAPARKNDGLFRPSVNPQIAETNAQAETDLYRRAMTKTITQSIRYESAPIRRRHSDHISLPKKETPPCMIFSREFYYLFFSHKSPSITIWDINNGTIKNVLNFSVRVTHIALNDTETQLFIGFSNGIIKYFEMDTLLESGELKGLSGEITNIAASDKISDLVFACSRDSVVNIWKLSSGYLIGKLKVGHPSNELSVFKWSKKHKTSDDFTRFIKMDHTIEQRVTQKFKTSARIRAIAIDPDGSRIYCVTKYKLYLWDITINYKEFETSLPNYRFKDAAIGNADSQFLYSITSKNVYCFDLSTSTSILKSKKVESVYTCLALSSDDSYLAVGDRDGQVTFFSTADFSVLFEKRLCSSAINYLKFYKSSKLFSSSEKGIIQIYDLDYQRNHEIKGHFQQVNDFCYVEDTNMLLTAGSDQILRLWALDTIITIGRATEVWRYIGQSPITRIHHIPHNKLIYFIEKNNIYGIDLKTKEKIFNGILPEEKADDLQDHDSEDQANVSVHSEHPSLYNYDSEAVDYETDVVDFEILIDLNLMIVIKEPNNILIYDLSNNVQRLSWNENDLIVKIIRPYNSTLIYCITDAGTVIQINLYKPTFVEKCYIQTLSRSLTPLEFRKNLRAFKDQSNLVFINKVLHPLTFAYLTGDTESLDYIFENYGFPDPFYFQKSPFTLAMKEKNIIFFEGLCEATIRCSQPILFSYKVLSLLFSTEYVFVKKLLASKGFESITQYTNTGEKIPRYQLLKKPQNMVYSLSGQFTKTHLEGLIIKKEEALPPLTSEAIRTMRRLPTMPINSLLEPLLPQKTIPTQYKPKRNQSKTHRNLYKRYDSTKLFRQAKLKKSQIEVFRVNGYYNFSRGSSDSLNFLLSYSNSNIKEFVLSDFKKIIHIKWNHSKRFFYTLATAYWTYCLFLTLLIFNPFSKPLFYINLGVSVSLMIFESIPLFFFPRLYLRDPYNLLDLISYILGLAVILTTYEHNPGDIIVNPYLQIVVELIVFYRALSYFRIFKYVRHISDVLFKLSVSVLDILVITGFLVMVFTVLSSIAGGFKGFQDTFMTVIFVAFSYFPDRTTMSNVEVWVLMLEIYVLTLILMNYLIAQMSNKYEELQERQKVTHHREMAKLLFEFEILYKTFFQKKDEKKYITYIVGDSKHHNQDDEQEVSAAKGSEDPYDILARVQSMNDKMMAQIDGRFQKMEQLIQGRFRTTSVQSMDNFDQPTQTPKRIVLKLGKTQTQI